MFEEFFEVLLFEKNIIFRLHLEIHHLTFQYLLFDNGLLIEEFELSLLFFFFLFLNFQLLFNFFLFNLSYFSSSIFFFIKIAYSILFRSFSSEIIDWLYLYSSFDIVSVANNLISFINIDELE